jgi:hypothetical protein
LPAQTAEGQVEARQMSRRRSMGVRISDEG